MAETARLRDPDLLLTLADQIQLFAVAGNAVLLEAEAGLAETEAWLDERRWYWQREVTERQEILDACLSNEDADCSYEAAALIDARAELENTERWCAQVADTGVTYRANAPRFRQVIADQCFAAVESLRRRAAVAGIYMERPGSAARVTAPRPAPAIATATPGNQPPPVLQRYTANGQPFADVTVRQIEEPTFAPGELEEADFLDMRHSFDRLPEIRRAIAQGTIDQLTAADPEANRAFRWFYGNDAIKVEWLHDHFSITNGKHRIYMARQLGLGSLPARVWTP